MTLEDFYQLPLRPAARNRVRQIALQYKRNVGGPLCVCIQQAEKLPVFRLADRLDPQTGRYVSPLSIDGLRGTPAI